MWKTAATPLCPSHQTRRILALRASVEGGYVFSSVSLMEPSHSLDA